MQLNDADWSVAHTEGKGYKAVHSETLAEFTSESLFDVLSQLEEHLADIDE